LHSHAGAVLPLSAFAAAWRDIARDGSVIAAVCDEMQKGGANGQFAARTATNRRNGTLAIGMLRIAERRTANKYGHFQALSLGNTRGY
jgi:hypothetical protein